MSVDSSSTGRHGSHEYLRTPDAEAQGHWYDNESNDDLSDSLAIDAAAEAAQDGKGGALGMKRSGRADGAFGALRARLAFAFAGEEYMDKTVFRMDNILLGLALFGQTMFVVQLWVGWDFQNNVYRNSLMTNLLKLATSLSTLALLWNIYKYHRFQMLMVVIKQRRVGRLVWRRKQLRSCAIEMFINVLHVPPWTPIPDLLGLLMVLRLYLVIRVLRDRSPTYRARFNIRKNAPSKIGFPTFNSLFAMKSLFDQSAMTLVLNTTLFTALMAAFLVHVAEREKQPADFGNLFNSLYFAVVTMTSVGYGDFRVTTVLGRVVAMITGFVGIILASMIVAVVTKILTLKQHQRFAVDWVKQQKYARNTKESCAALIQLVWRHYQSQKVRERHERRQQRLATTRGRARSDSLASTSSRTGMTVLEDRAAQQTYYRELGVHVSRCKRNRKKLALIQIKSAGYYQQEQFQRMEDKVNNLTNAHNETRDALARMERQQREILDLLLRRHHHTRDPYPPSYSNDYSGPPRPGSNVSTEKAWTPPPPLPRLSRSRGNVRFASPHGNDQHSTPGTATPTTPNAYREENNDNVTDDVYRGNYGANSMYGGNDSDSTSADSDTRSQRNNGSKQRRRRHKNSKKRKASTHDDDDDDDVDDQELSSFGFGTWGPGVTTTGTLGHWDDLTETTDTNG